MSETASYAKNIAKDSRYFPALIGVMMLGIFMLFFRELTPFLRNIFVPSLAIYILGTSMIAWLQTMLRVRSNFTLVSNSQLWLVIAVMHFTWFGLFVAYNFANK